MTDLSSLSDADLLAAYQQAKGGVENANIAALPKTDRDALQMARDDAEKARRMAREAQRFLQLNRETGTGGLRNLGWTDHFTAGDITAGMFGPNWDAMKGITSATAPQSRVAGSGATSDFEARMMVAGFPSVSKRGDTNTMITQRIEAENARARARAAFLDTWSKRKGTLNGADSAFSSWWDQYAPGHGLTGDPPVRRPAAGPVKKPTGGGVDPLGIRGR